MVTRIIPKKVAHAALIMASALSRNASWTVKTKVMPLCNKAFSTNMPKEQPSWT